MKTEPAITQEIQSPVAPSRKKLTPRQVHWARRRRALFRFWEQFRQSKSGMIGLGILLFYGAVAIFSIFANKGALDPTIASASQGSTRNTSVRRIRIASCTLDL